MNKVLLVMMVSCNFFVNAQTLLTTSGKTDLRTSADLSSTILAEIPAQQNVKLINFLSTGQHDGYFQVYFQGLTGYIHRNTVNFNDAYYMATNNKPVVHNQKSNSHIQSQDTNSYSNAFFPEVKIGHQIWMAKNLDVSKFRNGDIIPQAITNEEWMAAGGKDGKPAWCYYENQTGNGTVYGKLYNWHAVVDPRGLAPEGWHIPSQSEWLQLKKLWAHIKKLVT